MNDKGKAAEDFAADYLSDNGYKIICRNYFCRFGEIDIVCSDGTFLVFCEVKSRSLNSISTGRESVDRSKISRIRKTALWYLTEHKTNLQPRFDVLELTGTAGNYTVTAHITNAF